MIEAAYALARWLHENNIDADRVSINIVADDEATHEALGEALKLEKNKFSLFAETDQIYGGAVFGMPFQVVVRP